MTMDADQLHPPPGDGPVATADERWNIAGLDNVTSVLQTSPFVTTQRHRFASNVGQTKSTQCLSCTGQEILNAQVVLSM